MEPPSYVFWFRKTKKDGGSGRQWGWAVGYVHVCDVDSMVARVFPFYSGRVTWASVCIEGRTVSPLDGYDKYVVELDTLL